jgi:hypothetical protein
MRINFKKSIFCFFIIGILNFSSYALVGIGAQYGILDFTLSMKDATGEKAVFENLKLNVSSITGTNPGFPDPQISGSDIPIKIDRTKWQRSVLNFGGKAYVDIIPFLDCIEIAAHFGLWEYEGKIIYPKSMSFNNQPYQQGTPFINYVNVEYDTTTLTLKDLSMNNFMILSKTPYTKLDASISVRKYLFQFPPVVKILKLYAGAGFNINFATPMLSAKLIEDALGARLNTSYDINQFEPNLFGNIDIMADVCKEILAQMFTPHYACHILAGAMVKIPIIPLGVYVDGKFLIPFDKMDKYVDLGGYGFLLNAGIALAF